MKRELPIDCNLIGGEQDFELVFEQEGTKRFVGEAFSLASSP